MTLRLLFSLALVTTLAACSRPAAPASSAADRRALAPGEKRYALTGEVLRGDLQAGTLRVQHEKIEGLMGAMTMDFKASRGDISVYANGNRRIKADLIVNAASEFRLENIWPDDRSEAEIVAAGAKALREDTLIRGKGAFRDTGEMAPDFTLYDQDGRVVQASRFRGKQVMVNFIYTQCPDPNMCPLATSNMATAQALAKEAGIPDIEFISITMDPEFDTPGILKAYAAAHKLDTTNFTLLTGPTGAIKDLLKQFGVEAEFKGDLLKHTLATILIDRTGKIRHRADGSQWDPAEFVAGMKK